MTETTREEHLKYCKEEAYRCYEFHTSGKEYSDPDKAIQHACTTMLVDLGDHPETKKMAEAFILFILFIDSVDAMKRFIDGFN